MHDPCGAHGYHALPLSGSPADRLRADTVRQLASGLVPRCPHPGEPALWRLSAGMIACAACAHETGSSAGLEPAPCHACGAAADGIAAWVVGAVACLAHLCDSCRGSGLVPLTPN